MNTELEIIPVPEPRKSREFLDLQGMFNAGNPYFVHPLRMAVHKLLDRKYPFYRIGDAAFFLARRKGEAVGRIAAIHNKLHLETYGDRTGFFGFFECEDDPRTARALLHAAATWLRERGLGAMRGPVNYSMNDECPGVLVDGFEGPPQILMSYNPRWYGPLLERAGMAKVKDLYAYLVTSDTVAGDRFQRVMQAVRRRVTGVELRLVRMDQRGFRDDLRLMINIFNQAWARNWGFVPVTEAEADAIAADLKPIVNPAITGIATIEGKPAGMIVCVPNLNELLIDVNDGRLFPTGWWTLLRAVNPLIALRPRIRGFRTMMMGVLPEFRNRGVDALLIDLAIQNGLANGFNHCELSWVLEDNEAMNSLALKAGGDRYRTYRLFEADLQGWKDA